MYCIKCGALLDDADRFCCECGASQVEARFCPSCGTPNVADALFCCNCMTVFEKSDVVQTKQKSFLVDKKKVVGIAVVILVIIAAGIFLPKIKVNDTKPFLYAKGTKVYSTTGKEGVEIARLEEELIHSTYISTDGTYVFYIEDFDDDTATYDLCCKKEGKENAEEIKIASNVNRFTPLSGNKVVYCESDGSDENQRLYFYNGKEAIRITKDLFAEGYLVSEDEKKVIWQESDDGETYDVYVCELKKNAEPERLDKNITFVLYSDESLESIVYMKDDELYIWSDSEIEEIADDVYDVKICKDDVVGIQIYYFENKGNMDICLAEVTSVDIDIELDDDTKSLLSQNLYVGPEYSLHCYTVKNKEDVKIEKDGVISYVTNGVTGAADNNTMDNGIGYYKIDPMNLPVVSLSLYYDEPEEFYEEVYNIKEEMWEFYYADREGVSLIDSTYVEYEGYVEKIFRGNNEEICLVKNEKDDLFGNVRNVYWVGEDENGVRELGRSDGIASKVWMQDGSVYCLLKDSPNSNLELYCDGVTVASDIVPNSVKVLDGHKAFLFLKNDDYSEDNYNQGVLYMYHQGVLTKISESVPLYEYGYTMDEKGRVLFLTDFDFDDEQGDLNLYKNGEIIEIDTKVHAIIQEQNY
ncbi:MAG: hypothetical protein E7299_08825 [Lachnospiraceae bacterium]|nr:hypothetical protein [Lachnospiraceae bacterium]